MSEPLPEDAHGASDAALISRIREGDTASYGVLYERHVAAARGLARHLTGSETEAEDAVSETFTKLLSVLRRGGGPQDGFRPYLLTSVRRTIYDRYRSDKRLTPTDEIELYDSGEPFVDPALEGLERSMIVKAFLSLPERWRAVLWHTEIEGQKPGEVAVLLGLTANGTAALAYRAREGLREAYLQMHIAAGPREECGPALDKLGAYVRGGLAKRDSAMVEHHLDACDDCRAIYAELADVNRALRTAIGPLVLGTATAAYLAAAKGGAGIGYIFGWWRHLPKRQQQVLGGGTAAAAVAAAILAGLLLVGNSTPIAHHPPKAAPAPAAPVPQHPAPPQAQPPAAAPPAPRPPAPKPPAKPAKAPAKHTPKHPTPKPTPPPPAHLAAQINTVGTLVRNTPGIVAMAVRNDGAGASQPVTADVTLPPGVSFLGASTGRTSVLFVPFVQPGGGWNCRPYGTKTPSSTVSQTVRCTHSGIAPHAEASAYLHVQVASDAPFDRRPQIAVASDRTKPVTAKADTGVQATGMPARFAIDGHVRTIQTGNALESCPEHAPGCLAARQRKGHRRDNDLWYMRPIDLDNDPTTKSSSSASLTIPTGATVLWAGLYWSGVDCDTTSPTARVKGPGESSYTTVKAGETKRAWLPGYRTYQAFTDVTALVQRVGGGQWWVADVPSEYDVGTYAGWSLVVVVQDPNAPLQQAMVLDGDHAVLHGDDPLQIPVEGLLPTAAPGRLGLVGWEGDADLKGDQLRLAGRPLTPEGGDRDPDNVMDSSAVGAIGPSLTFGVNVDLFSAVLGSKQTLELVTDRDAYLVGVVTVTVPMRS